jgi:hypothetical protein
MDKFEDPNGKRVKLYQNLSLTKKMKPKNWTFEAKMIFWEKGNFIEEWKGNGWIDLEVRVMRWFYW